MSAPPLRVSLLSTVPSNTHTVKVHSGYAYAGDGDNLLLIDVRNPQQPAIVGRYRFVGRAQPLVVDIEVQPPMVYVATNDRFSVCCLESMVNMLDVTQPAQPVLRDRRGGIGVADLAVADQRIYVAGINWNYSAPDLTIYDIVNASSLVPRGTYGGGGSAAVAVSGSFVYLADYEGSIRVVDVSDADQPVLVGTVDTPGSAYNLQVAGSYLYVADGSAGLSIFDLSTPHQPALRATHQTQGAALQLHVVDGRAYLAEGDHGVSILDVGKLDAVEFLAAYDTPGYTSEIRASGTLLYVADLSGGLHILQMSH
jgi:hypothetical protein